MLEERHRASEEAARMAAAAKQQAHSMHQIQAQQESEAKKKYKFLSASYFTLSVHSDQTSDMDLESEASRYMHLHFPSQKIKSVPAKCGAQLKMIAISMLIKIEKIAIIPSVYFFTLLSCSPVVLSFSTHDVHQLHAQQDHHVCQQGTTCSPLQFVPLQKLQSVAADHLLP